MSKEALFEFGRRELSRLPDDRGLKIGPREAVIRCPYHSGGQERTPSMKVNLDPTAPAPALWVYCRACKRSESWNELAETLHLRKVARKSSQRHDAAEVNLVRRRHVTLSEEESALPDLHKMVDWPVTVPWRTIPGPTLRRYSCKTVTWGKSPLLYIPVIQYGEHVGGIRALVERDRSDKRQKAYVNTPGDWMNRSLLGFDVAASLSGEPLWVVEGPRDTFHVSAAGARVVGLLGSALTPKKVSLIRDLDPPVIVSATDGDEAGDTAHTALLEQLGRDFEVVRYPFRDGEDPCEVPYSKIERANVKVRELVRRAA